MRTALGICFFLSVGAAAFLADGRSGPDPITGTDAISTGSIDQPRAVYQAAVEGEVVRCWMSQVKDEIAYRFAGPECSKLGIGHPQLVSVLQRGTGDLTVRNEAGEDLLHLSASDGNGWEASPDSGKLIDLIATFD
ncbi:hypothetical protein [Notoacmeibacter ruber]|uniref:Alkaline proteinase inhibitor/ Outer membrane lipoprotein Omp19 domain-containing protein n=1 Tax=Notoacmeibacter ruber TaxID=2670375 RepID=A0A3L7JFW8_9HYPH|nr:hypothetical protein [Notoacmeibacter ruber]RLQ88501.1 hypothetical protein D8780_10060 [Notoacmeibacter ruber]